MATLHVRPVLRQRIQKNQERYPQLTRIREQVQQGANTSFSLQEGVLVIGERLCVPNVDNLRREILDEAHNAPYAMHPGTTKMYRTLRQHYWWPKMKTDVADFVSTCLTCQQVKAEHQAPLFQYLCGNGRESLWILLQGYREPRGVMTQYG